MRLIAIMHDYIHICVSFEITKTNSILKQKEEKFIKYVVSINRRNYHREVYIYIYI
jgi:hypothetical protein